MKKIFLLSLLVSAFAFTVQAQRYAVIDTKYILSKIPEYREADKKLQLIGEQWQKEQCESISHASFVDTAWPLVLTNWPLVLTNGPQGVRVNAIRCCFF